MLPESIKLLEEKLKEYLKLREHVLSNYRDNWYETVKFCDGAIEAIEFAIKVVATEMKEV